MSEGKHKMIKHKGTLDCIPELGILCLCSCSSIWLNMCGWGFLYCLKLVQWWTWVPFTTIWSITKMNRSREWSLLLYEGKSSNIMYRSLDRGSRIKNRNKIRKVGQHVSPLRQPWSSYLQALESLLVPLVMDWEGPPVVIILLLTVWFIDNKWLLLTLVGFNSSGLHSSFLVGWAYQGAHHLIWEKNYSLLHLLPLWDLLSCSEVASLIFNLSSLVSFSLSLFFLLSLLLIRQSHYIGWGSGKLTLSSFVLLRSCLALLFKDYFVPLWSWLIYIYHSLLMSGFLV